MIRSEFLSAPPWISELCRYNLSSAIDLEVSGNTLLILDSIVGLTLFDISDVTSPVELGRYELSGGGKSRVSVVDEIAYISTWDGLCTLNISDPSNPRMISSLYFGVAWGHSGIEASYLAGDLWYLGFDGDFLIVNVTDPSSMAIVSSCPVSGYSIKSIIVQGSVAFVAMYPGLCALDVSDPENVECLWIRCSDMTLDMLGLRGDVLYAAGLEDDEPWLPYIISMRIADVLNPYRMDKYRLSRWAGYEEHISLLGEMVLLPIQKMLVIDAADPKELYEFADTSIPTRCIVVMSELILSTYREGFWIAEHDFDEDDLGSLAEMKIGTDPWDSDSDSDSMYDGWEVTHGLDPLTHDSWDDLDSDGLDNAHEFRYQTLPRNPDTDNDSLSDGLEVLEYGTNPLSNDTDQDSMPDAWEITYGLDPLRDDSEGDLDLDDLSNALEYKYCTNPTNRDSDGDTMPDGWEVFYGLCPVVDDANEDPDKDGSTNIEEFLRNTSPNDHGLKWHVRVNDTLAFTLIAEAKLSEYSDSVQEGVMIEIRDLSRIPAVIDFIPSSSYQAYWATNGSWFSLSGYFSLEGASLVPLTPAITAGNWTLLSEVVRMHNTTGSDRGGYSLIETGYVWGLAWKVEGEEGSIASRVTWYKTDGTLKRVELKLDLGNSGRISVDLVRADALAGISPLQLIVFGVGSIATMSVVLFLASKSREP